MANTMLSYAGTALFQNGVVRLAKDANLPKRMTEGSACYDVELRFPDNENLFKLFTHTNVPFWGQIVDDKVHIPARGRALLPTALILNIPFSLFVKLYIRSSLALKKGLILSNSVGIIDSDYHEQLLVMVTNTSDDTVSVNVGERIAQIEYCPRFSVRFDEHTEVYGSTGRNGGFGSTGT
jgi:dUTP pyrophosphatase